MRRLLVFTIGVVMLCGGLVTVGSSTATASVWSRVPTGLGSPPSPRPSASAGTSTVRLITGDVARVTTLPGGRVAARLVAGPHLRGDVARWSTPTQSFLVPRLSPEQRRVLDPSLFDVERLAQAHGSRLPVVVTGRDGHRVRRSYSSLHLTPARLRRLRSIRLADVRRAREVAGPTYTLSVQLHDGDQPWRDGAVMLVENVDDSRTFLENADVDSHGLARIDVPAGHYSIAAWADALLVDPEVDVEADTGVDLDFADATVLPRVTLPGHRTVEAVLSVERAPAKGFTVPLGFSGPSFAMRVAPQPADVVHGSLATAVTAKLAGIGSGPPEAPGELAVTEDVAAGIPHTLTFDHHRHDFARVVQRFYADGPVGQRQTWVEAASFDGGLFTGTEFTVPVPGRRVLLLQAGADAYFQQSYFPLQRPGTEGSTTDLTIVDSFPRAGATHVESFAHGPVGPGLEGRSAFAGAARAGDRLRVFLPLFAGAGSRAGGSVDAAAGSWTLSSGRRRIAHGTGGIYVDHNVPAGRRAYTLDAVSHPTVSLWTLSTHVRDVWVFHSRHGAAAVPILTPSYVPPSTMAGSLAPGPTGFALTFDAPTHDRITGARVQLSTDGGRHWSAATLTRTGATSFRVRYPNPAHRGRHRFMSLRVTGRDRAGNAVQETAQRVYRLADAGADSARTARHLP